MYLDITVLIVFTIILFGIYLWWIVQAIRQRALAHAKRRCKELDLQLLDGSLALRIKGMQRDPNGILTPLFTGTFEFSATGDDRYEGVVYMLGNRLQRIEIPPHRII